MHLSDLDELSQEIKNTNSKKYFEEAVAAYRASAYRSALIATWISVCVDIIEKIRELSTTGDAQATKIFEKLDNISPADFKAMQDFEQNILGYACESLQLITHIEKEHLENLKKDRNICAHPTFSDDGSQFSPPAELALSYLVQSAKYLLTQLPVSGKVVIDRLYQLITKEAFPEDEEKAFMVLSSDHNLGRTKDSGIRNLVIILIKRLFVDHSSLMPDKMNKILASLGAISRLKSAIYNEVIKEKLEGLLERSNDNCLKRYYIFLARKPESFKKIGDSVKIRLKEILKLMSVNELVRYELTQVATNSSEMNKVYQEAVDKLEENDEKILLASVNLPLMKDRAIDFFIKSKSFSLAVYSGFHIVLPNCKNFCDEDLRSVLMGALGNGNGDSINQIMCSNSSDVVF